ncbi:polysaccharide pyruvyl transferase family protein [Rhizobium lentis]|uniref:polysaccharide pyruvyl transferase family protein n=1 Tax=Rhizobium lentis TaxID=1138194 RepID=UPI001C8354E1|nr:polysaccharide pyruvyl transferase family protein [Rhizobium lentis]MBX5143085.1 polysaccharide pyruvyl transferase family protein [Rhizobium lentis]
MTSARYLVCGPYGSGNLGDDAIALEITNQIERYGGTVHIAGIDAGNFTKSTGRKIGFVRRLDLRRLKVSLIGTLWKCDVVVIGGGEQFSEPRFPNPLWGHLATNFQLYMLAKIFRKKFAAVGVGVSDGLSSLGRFAMRRIALGADFFSVRDEGSFQRLKALAPSADILLSADPAFLGEQIDRKKARSQLCTRFKIESSSKIVIIMPSNDKFHSLAYVEQLNTSVKKLNEAGVEVVYAVSDSQEGYDSEIFDRDLLHTSKMARWAQPGSLSLMELIELITAADCLVSSRMHPLIFATCQMTPFVCLSRAGKMDALMKMLGDENYLRMNFTPAQLVDLVMSKLNAAMSDVYVSSVGLARASASAQFDNLAKLAFKEGSVSDSR